MHDVLIVEAAHHMHNGVALPDVGQKLVAQALALGGALDQAGNVHKFHHAGVVFLGWYISVSASSRWSGTATTPTLGSMVQKG